LWISATGSESVSKTITQNGIIITLKATRTTMNLDMGNGDAVNCTTTRDPIHIGEILIQNTCTQTDCQP
jgi:hypothetical protein